MAEKTLVVERILNLNNAFDFFRALEWLKMLIVRQTFGFVGKKIIDLSEFSGWEGHVMIARRIPGGKASDEKAARQELPQSAAFDKSGREW